MWENLRKVQFLIFSVSQHSVPFIFQHLNLYTLHSLYAVHRRQGFDLAFILFCSELSIDFICFCFPQNPTTGCLNKTTLIHSLLDLELSFNYMSQFKKSIFIGCAIDMNWYINAGMKISFSSKIQKSHFITSLQIIYWF